MEPDWGDIRAFVDRVMTQAVNDDGAPECIEGYIRFRRRERGSNPRVCRENIPFCQGKTDINNLYSRIRMAIRGIITENGTYYVEAVRAGAEDKFDSCKPWYSEGDSDAASEAEDLSTVGKAMGEVCKSAALMLDTSRRGTADTLDCLISVVGGIMPLAKEIGELEATIRLASQDAKLEAMASILRDVGPSLIQGLTVLFASQKKSEPLPQQPESATPDRIAWDIAAIERCMQDVIATAGQNPSSMTDENLRKLEELLQAATQGIAVIKKTLGK